MAFYLSQEHKMDIVSLCKFLIPNLPFFSDQCLIVIVMNNILINMISEICFKYLPINPYQKAITSCIFILNGVSENVFVVNFQKIF